MCPQPHRFGGAGQPDAGLAEHGADEPRAVVAAGSRAAPDIRLALLGGRPGEHGRDPVGGQWWQVGVPVTVSVAAVLAIPGDHDGAAPTRVAPRVVQDVVAVGQRVVVGPQGLQDALSAAGQAGLDQVFRRGEDRVGVVADVAASVVVSVDAVGGEGPRHELHQALGPGGAGRVVAAVPGLGHADPRQEFPRHPVLIGGRQVQLSDPGWDGLGWAGERLVARSAPLRQLEADPVLLTVGDGDVELVGVRRAGFDADLFSHRRCDHRRGERDRPDRDADGEGQDRGEQPDKELHGLSPARRIWLV